MRTSIAALALIARRPAGDTEYLAQWNPGWTAFNFVGGHKHDGETFRECVVREIGEELDVSTGDFSMPDDPAAHLEYVAMSRRAGTETSYTVELFNVELRSETLADEIGRRAQNIWLRTSEIAAGAARDGRAVSPTMPLLLRKTGRLPAERRPAVFTIGVTGHRDLPADDRAATSQKLHALCDAAEREAGRRKIESLSPLAAGADQLFAQVALERGYRLIAPLPLPIELYRRDFTGESAVEFERLLHSAAEWYSLPPERLARRDPQAINAEGVHLDGLGRPSSNDENLSGGDIAVDGAARERMYEAVGRHVVERSDLLVALWDGRRNGKRGGTGEIVEFARGAGRNERPRIEIVRVRRQNQV